MLFQQNNNLGYLKSLTVLHTALLAGQIIFAVVAFALVYTGNFPNSLQDMGNIFFLLVPLSIIAGRLVGTMLYKKKLGAAVNSNITADRLNMYRAAFILRCALIEGPVLFAIIIYLLTNNTEILLFALGGIFLFTIIKPTKEKIMSELQVSESDIS